MRSRYADNPGGVGIGSGAPLAPGETNPGGVGIGKGAPLAPNAENPGGVGMGRGAPLTVSEASPGGVGMGRGAPLRATTESVAERLLDKCLTEVLTGSTMKTAQVRTARPIKAFFFMDELLLAQP